MDIRFVKGQEQPEIQGWYSPEYNLYSPNTTTIYTVPDSGNQTLVWLLMPSEGQSSPVKARLLAENAEEVRVEVSAKGKTWKLTVPYENSAGAALER